MSGCAHLNRGIEPVRCNEPVLKGNTWADVVILTIEQQQALKECNLKNGFAPVSKAHPRKVTPASPVACRLTGVDVEDGDYVRGRIVGSYEHKPGTAFTVCGLGTVGCTLESRHAEGAWEIHYEPSENDWVWLHERCHALYETHQHTDSYNLVRGIGN